MRARDICCAAALWAAAAAPGQAAEIAVTLDRVTLRDDTYIGADGGPFKAMFADGLPADDVGLMHGKFRPGQFEDYKPFNTNPKPNGLILANSAKAEIQDLHLRLLGDDTFKRNADDKPASTGGKAFTDTAISADGRELTFSGGSLEAGETLWAVIPGLSDKAYSGLLTPRKAPAPDAPRKEGASGMGSGGQSPDNAPRARFSPGPAEGSGLLEFGPGSVDAVRYADGHSGPPDPLLGATVSIGAMQPLSQPSDIAGALLLSDAPLSIRRGSEVLLSATLSRPLLYNDRSVAGFDSVLQATLLWDFADLAAGSHLLDLFYAPNGGLAEDGLTLLWRSNLLSQTDGLTRATAADAGLGRLYIGAAVPEPAAAWLLCAGLAVAGAAARRRGSAFAAVTAVTVVTVPMPA